MKKTNIMKAVAFMSLFGITAVSAHHAAAEEQKERTIYAGVYLDGVSVGGLTKEEAIAEYEDYIEGIEDFELTFSTSVGDYTTTLGDIDISVSAEDAVEQALNYGRQGNILSRYKEIKALENENIVLVPTKKYNKEALKGKLEKEAGDIVTEAKDASLSRQNGEFVIYEGESGTAIQVDQTIAELDKLLAGEWTRKDIKINAVVEEQKPRYTAEDFYQVDSVMGDYSTQYNSGNTSRGQNLTTGASKISGTVLMPGEQFSMYKTVAPFTEANGYAAAGQYVNNELVDGLGGGICQVSTTLYNAVLKAELQVDERCPHSLTVSYVPLSQDAAIAGDYMDFKFTNNTDYPIYIEGYAGGGTISFAIYGHDERPSNRTISFESKTIEIYEPGDPQETKDDTMEEGQRVTEQEAHTGYYAELWKNIYVDGELIDSVKVNGSQYTAQAAKVRVGTKKVKKEEEKDEEEEKDKDTKKKEKKTEATTSTEKVTEATTEAKTEAATEAATSADEGE